MKRVFLTVAACFLALPAVAQMDNFQYFEMRLRDNEQYENQKRQLQRQEEMQRQMDLLESQMRRQQYRP